MDEIIIKAKTIEKLKQLTQELQKIQSIINTILETVISENDGEGSYELTHDWKLIKK